MREISRRRFLILVRRSCRTACALFFLVLGCMVTGTFPVDASEAWEDRIASLDPQKPEDLTALQVSLAAHGVLGYSKVREKFLSFSAETLQGLLSRTARDGSLSSLHRLIQQAIPRPEDRFYLCEDFLVNHRPVIGPAPFFTPDLKGTSIKATKAYAERIYVDNLPLKYQPAALTVAREDLWAGMRVEGQKTEILSAQSEGSKGISGLWTHSKAGALSRVWSWALKDDLQHDPLNAQAFLRQFMKHYEESALRPVLSQDSVIFRNGYRLFCLSLANGKELWSLAPENGGAEFYHTFRHPHQNAYGYDLLLDQGTVYCELDGKLTAVDVRNIPRPQIQWTRELGEYTLCTRPVVVKSKVIVGLVNARGEIWFCGFDAATGALAWSRYAGMSSFLGPVCTLSALAGNQVIIATNHGILVALSPEDGRIVWLKKYASRRYSSLDYWDKGYYKDKFHETGSLPFDTQFLKAGTDGWIYYKPRESDHFYVLDAGSGETVRKFFVDPALFYVLDAHDGKVVFFQKAGIAQKENHVILADLRSGTEIFNETVPEGGLKGISFYDRGRILFKVGKTLCSLDIADQKEPLKRFSTPVPGWLLSVTDQGALVGDGREVQCLAAKSGGEPKEISGNGPAPQLLAGHERIRGVLVEIGRTHKFEKDPRLFFAEARELYFPASELFDFVKKNSGLLRQPAWKGFVEALDHAYGGSVITDGAVEMNFGGFLRGEGLIVCENKLRPEKVRAGQLTPSTQQGYQFDIGETSLRPVKVIRGEELLDFYLLFNNGQIVCVGERGDIRWVRKIFFGPLWSEGNESGKSGHLYSEDIEAYLYENVLIVNDRVNIIAVDVHTGAYLWSMTNSRMALNDPTQLPSFMKRWSYEARFYFSKNIMMRAQFVGDTLMVSHGGMLYALDPKTGYCKASRSADLSCVMAMKAYENRLYVASLAPDVKIRTFDQYLEPAGDFSAQASGASKEQWPRLVILPHYLLFDTRAEALIFEKGTGRVAHTLAIQGRNRYYLEPFRDGFILVAPFLEVCGYRLEGGKLQKLWVYPLAPENQGVVWGFTAFRSAYYYRIDEERMLTFIRRKDDYAVLALELATGKLLWQTRLDGIRGRFFNLSNAVLSRDAISFIMTCVYAKENYEKDLGLEPRLGINSGILAADIDSMLFSLDLQTGKAHQSRRLPSNGLFEFTGEDIVQTKHHIVYNLYRRSVHCETKEEQ